MTTTTIGTTRTRPTTTEATRPRGRRQAGARNRVELGHQLVDLLGDFPTMTVNLADELGIGQHDRNTLRVVLDRMAGLGLVEKRTGFGTAGTEWLMAVAQPVEIENVPWPRCCPDHFGVGGSYPRPRRVTRHEAHERWAGVYERVTRPSSRASRCGRVRAQRWADFL